MAISITQVHDFCLAILNAATDTYGTVNDPLRFDTEIKDAIKMADRVVAQAIIDTPGHRRAAEFAVLEDVTSTVGTSGSSGVIPFPIYAVQIDGKNATYVRPDRWRLLANNALNLTTNVGYYTLENQELGAIYSSSVKVQRLKYVEPAGDTLASPEEYLGTVTAGALAYLFPKEGAYVQAADHYAGVFETQLKMIREGQTVMPGMPGFTLPAGKGGG